MKWMKSYFLLKVTEKDLCPFAINGLIFIEKYTKAIVRDKLHIIFSYILTSEFVKNIWSTIMKAPKSHPAYYISPH